MTSLLDNIERVPVASLKHYPGNARRGDVTAIAASLAENDQYAPIVVQASTRYVLAGNHTLKAAQLLGWPDIDVVIVDVDDTRARKINLSSNRTADLGEYDLAALAGLLDGLDGNLTGTGYTDDDLAAMFAQLEPDVPPAGHGDPDDVPEPPAEPVTVLGDLWKLGENLLLCGDSTIPADVQLVTGGQQATLIHADPPYGMGKEADGVLNDNLYGPKLDVFQMRWWRAWLPALTGNGSAYIWGNAPDLWRLWWVGGLGGLDLMVRNEIVWDKGSAPGMRSAEEHSFVTATERCLFLMRGKQFLGNQNKDEFWEGYEPLRSWLCAERDKAGWGSRDVNTLTGTQMAGHWFTRSQFAPIPAGHYRTLQDAAGGRAFTRDYDGLFAEMFPEARADGNAYRRDLAAQLREQRTFFDNAHDIMTDVWTFPRVTGDERQGHATPKPVAMVERAVKSSSAPGDLIGVPFGGSGPEYIAAYRLGRRAAGIEREPRWVDTICRRFERYTGIMPERVLPDGTTEPVCFMTPEVLT